MFKPLVLSDIVNPGATSTTRPAPAYETTKGPRWLLSVRGHGGTSPGAMDNPLMFFMQCLISLAGLRGSLMLQLESAECSASGTMMRQLDSTERLVSATPTAQINLTDHQLASSRLWSQSHGSSDAPSHVNREPGNMFKPLVLSDIVNPGATSTTRPAPAYETTKGPRWLLSVRGHGGTSPGAMDNPLMFFMQVSEALGVSAATDSERSPSSDEHEDLIQAANSCDLSASLGDFSSVVMLERWSEQLQFFPFPLLDHSQFQTWPLFLDHSWFQTPPFQFVGHGRF
ncbi:hypothetical protein HPB47_010598 [Ixodes persulcatus]|uniref:Uncharacterized protein n=1 Tax=Ixodes persulcatus TaxID=34615 RepID=A0AC60NYJ4_IXOPE|nr:hypothetical protein HPB47_010598 [Ixodes persulcatus]